MTYLIKVIEEKKEDFLTLLKTLKKLDIIESFEISKNLVISSENSPVGIWGLEAIDGIELQEPMAFEFKKDGSLNRSEGGKFEDYGKWKIIEKEDKKFMLFLSEEGDIEEENEILKLDNSAFIFTSKDKEITLKKLVSQSQTTIYETHLHGIWGLEAIHGVKLSEFEKTLTFEFKEDSSLIRHSGDNEKSGIWKIIEKEDKRFILFISEEGDLEEENKILKLDDSTFIFTSKGKAITLKKK